MKTQSKYNLFEKWKKAMKVARKTKKTDGENFEKTRKWLLFRVQWNDHPIVRKVSNIMDATGNEAPKH